MTDEETNLIAHLLGKMAPITDGNVTEPTSDLEKAYNGEPTPGVDQLRESYATDLGNAFLGQPTPGVDQMRAGQYIQNSGINDPLQGQFLDPAEFGPTNEGGTITALSPFDVPGGVPEVGYESVPPGQEPFVAYDKVVSQTPFGGNSDLLIDSIPTGTLPSQDPGAGSIPTSMPMKPRMVPSSEGSSGGFVNSSGLGSSSYEYGPAELAGLTQEEKELKQFKRDAELRAQRQVNYDAKRAEDYRKHGPMKNADMQKMENIVAAPFRFGKEMLMAPGNYANNFIEHVYRDGGIDKDGNLTGTGRYANNSLPDWLAQGTVSLAERLGSLGDWVTGKGGTGLGEDLPSASRMEALNNRTGGVGNINIDNVTGGTNALGTGDPAAVELGSAEADALRAQEAQANKANDLNLIGFNPKYEDQKLSDFMNYNDNPNTPTEQFLDPQGRLRRRYVGTNQLTPQYASYEREAELRRQRLGARPDFNTPVSDAARRAKELLGAMPAKEVFNPRTVNGFFETEPGKFVQIEQGESPSQYGGVSGNEMQNVNQIIQGMDLDTNKLYYKDGQLYQDDWFRDTLLTPQQVAQIRATEGGEAFIQQMIKNANIQVLPE